VGFTSGQVGEAFSFPGNGPYVSLGDPVDLQVTGDLTIAGWMNTLNATRVQHIFARRGGSCGANGYVVALDCRPASGTTSSCSTAVEFAFNAGGAEIWSGLTPSAGLWHYFAVVFHSSTGSVDFYLDGSTVTQSANTTSLGNPSGADVEIGSAHGCNPILTFAGDLDELRLYSQALASTDILQLAACQ
jgi:hypothetical protein